MEKPVIVLVGRPNVGKSTLFNRLVGERLAIVDDVPGTTRDRLLAEGDWAGHDFFVVDTGGIDPSKQRSQTPLSIGSADFIQDIREQAEIALEEADVILLVTDAIEGVTQADHEVVDILRRRRAGADNRPTPPILLVVNNADSEQLRLTGRLGVSLQIRDLFAIGWAFAKPVIRWLLAMRKRQSAAEKAKAAQNAAKQRETVHTAPDGAGHTTTSTSTKES